MIGMTEAIGFLRVLRADNVHLAFLVIFDFLLFAGMNEPDAAGDNSKDKEGDIATLKRYAHLPFGYWICPSLILLAGAVIILRPSWVASAPLVIIGAFMILFGIVECINALKIHSERKKMESQQAEALPEETSGTAAGGSTAPEETVSEQPAPETADSKHDDSGSFGI